MRIKRIVSVLGMLTLTINTTISTVGYYFQDRDSYVSMIGSNYWKITNDKSYYNFVKHYEKEITKPASEQSNQDFDNLYAKDDITTGWNNYSSLEHDLTTKVLSPKVTLNLNWTNLFQQVNLSDQLINQGQNKLFHFYNIIANLYGKENILRLLQWAKLDKKTENFGYISSYVPFGLNQQIMGLGTIFADLDTINHSYSFGFAATNDLISTIVHEYGHAVSSFLKAEPKERGSFNNNPFPESKNLQNKEILNWNDLNNVTAQSIPECADLLVDSLNEEANIGTDPIKKEFFPLIVVRSNYGRSYWLQDIDNYWRKKNEFFAEAFDEWIDTPRNERTWNWELLNQFFIKKLPSYFN